MMETATPTKGVTQDRMTRERYKKVQAGPNPDQKIRRCLMCRKDFESAWAGERICRKCKSSSAWRNG